MIKISCTGCLNAKRCCSKLINLPSYFLYYLKKNGNVFHRQFNVEPAYLFYFFFCLDTSKQYAKLSETPTFSKNFLKLPVVSRNIL